METRKQVTELRKENSQLTCADIAKKVGISKERVRMILAKEGLPTRRTYPKYPCANCGNPIPRVYIYIPKPSKYCSKKCYSQHIRSTLICGECGKPFPILTTELHKRQTKRNRKEQDFYCSPKCWGKHLSKLYGYQRSQRSTRTLKILWLARLNFTIVQIAKITNCNYHYVWYILQRNHYI